MQKRCAAWWSSSSRLISNTEVEVVGGLPVSRYGSPQCWKSITFLCGSGSNSGSDSFLQWLQGCKTKFSSHFFLTRRHIIFSVKFFFAKIFVKILFCKNYFSPLNFMRKRKGPDPEPDPYFKVMDPDPDPGGPKTSVSGSPTLVRPYLSVSLSNFFQRYCLILMPSLVGLESI